MMVIGALADCRPGCRSSPGVILSASGVVRVMSVVPKAPSLAMTSLSIRDFRGSSSSNLISWSRREPNGLVVLAGPNGCGKTAVLKPCDRGRRLQADHR